ncbi:MAG: M20/M25/M40 family metallo-hydrolase [Pseudohongiellaceae bacterium]
MMQKWRYLLLALGAALASAQAQPQPDGVAAAAPGDFLRHEVQVRLDPDNEAIRVADTIRFPDRYRGRELSFSLNSNLVIGSSSLPVMEVTTGASAGGVVNSTVAEMASARQYRVRLPANSGNELTLSYEGRINDLAEQDSREYAQSFAATSGIISPEGVFLSGASVWVPRFNDELITFSLAVTFAGPARDWTAVSQGRQAMSPGISASGATPQRWVEDQPMEEIYLIAADFTVYEQQAGDTRALAYLRTPDANLATRYLDATGRYLALYEPLLGDYPFSKFALVENFWETGYGMPSFTLLGERVLRFPFILETSYPHEILHNWWGNGVYPDYDTGNWSEGLTAYLADHLFRETDGAGQQYRKEMLGRYKNYVADSSDFPLSDFTARNSAATQAVGYGKTLMLWHMLRVELGDELFLEGLRRFYDEFLFRRASYADIERLFSELSGRDLSAFFAQWVQRTGAPELSLSVDRTNDNRARLMFAQIQSGPAYALTVPVALFYEGEEQPRIYNVALSQKLEGVMADDYDRLQGVLVDPWFDVFRRLDREETPPTVGELFGAERIAFVLPSANRQHWRQLALAFAEGVDARVIDAEDIDALPADRSVWILGRDNPFLDAVSAATANYGGLFSDQGVDLAGTATEFGDRSTVAIGRHPANPDLAVGWIHIDDMVAVPGMIEKLPHYGRYSYLSFTGSEPTNDLSGIWASPDSPMQWLNPQLAASVDFTNLPALTPLATLPPKYLPDGLMSHVHRLTAPEMEGRGLGSPGLLASANYIADEFRAAGLRPVGGTYQQRWRDVLAGHGELELGNVIGMIPGSNRQLSAAPVVVGAHYDHLGRDPQTGQIFPGADDNASGVAVMLEVASQLSRAFTPQRPILFVAFTAEEAGLLGSRHFVDTPPAPFASDDLFAMINLDAVGRLEGKPLQVFATDSAYEWPFMAQGIGFTIGVDATFPSATIASSDHVPFLNAGIPAIHLFSGTHGDYHRPSDSAAKLDARGMADVALWLEEAVIYLANRTEPLRVQLEGAEQVQVSGASGAREASLGTVPDFAHTGEGVRISGVTPDSAAASAGLQAGDILLRFNGNIIDDLQTYSDLLRQAAPGDPVTIELNRAGERLRVETELRAR